MSKMYRNKQGNIYHLRASNDKAVSLQHSADGRCIVVTRAFFNLEFSVSSSGTEGGNHGKQIEEIPLVKQQDQTPCQ